MMDNIPCCTCGAFNKRNSELQAEIEKLVKQQAVIKADVINMTNDYKAQLAEKTHALVIREQTDAKAIKKQLKIEQLQAEIEKLKEERAILAMLSADKPQFFNPRVIFAAKSLRDRVLKGKDD